MICRKSSGYAWWFRKRSVSFTASQQAKSIIKMQDTDNAAEYLATAATKPSLLLRGENPRLIDEWQDAPNLWDAVRDTVDNRSDVGLYILTGSTVVDKNKIKHLGDGRYALVECKLGGQEIEEGAAHLTEIVRLIREPDQLIVLTGGTMAYTRQDGVKIIPLGCLKW